MGKLQASVTWTVVGLLATACGGGPETTWIRLVDEFDGAAVEGTPATAEPERTEWRFDGGGTVRRPDQNAATMGWTVLNDVSGLAVRDGRLVGTTGTVPIVLGHSPDGLDGDDLLYAVEVRMRVSAGATVGLNTNGAQQLSDEAGENIVEGITNQPRAQLRAELTPGDDFLTYSLREAGATIRLSAMRNLLLQPSDAEGAAFEIESIRIIPLKEHLASVPSGPGWHGLAEIYHETIVSRAPERIVLDVELPARPWLDLAYGTIEDGPVTFEVTVTSGGTESSVFERTVTTPDRWSTTRVDLSEFAGEPVTLALGLSAEAPGALGYWGSPVVRNSGAMPEVDQTSADRAMLEDGGTRRPRAVILFLADALRRDHLDAYGYERTTAPTLTRIAQEGVRFADNISQGAWTKVSVPSMLTSLYPTSHGITDLPDRLPSSVTTMAEVFRAAGYATWQTSSVPFSGKLSNLQQGVDVLHERTSVPDLGHSPAKTARTYVDRFLEWAEDHHDVPFFALVHVFDPHSPFEPYPPYDNLWGTGAGAAEYERGMDLWEGGSNPDGLPTQEELDGTDVDQAIFIQQMKDWYDGSIRAMDAELARLMEGLEQLGLADETLFAFISDHGEEFLEHGYSFHGNSVYGEMMNVPLVMWWPGVLPAGTVVEQTTESLDMMPTLLDLAGITPPETAQGQSLVPLIVDPGSVADFGAIRRAAFSERVAIPSAGAMGNAYDSYAIVLDGWKLIKNEGAPESVPEYELYDHEADPINMHDVAGEHPDIVERLAAELATWREYVLSLKPPPDSEAIEGLSAEEIARLRSLGYINN
jgi:arylsulfatase A-like enzyme